MKKYILSLFALFAFLMPVVGLSANGLTDPGTVDGERQSPLYRLFYKEHQISSNDSTAYEDSEGTKYSFNDIFSEGEVDVTTASIDDTTNNIEETGDDYVIIEKMIENTKILIIDYDNPATWTEGDSIYQSVDFTVTENVDDYSQLGNFRPANVKLNGEEGPLSVIDTVSFDEVRTGFKSNSESDSITVRIDHILLADMEQFESEPSKSQMDTYRDVYLTVEEGETYYYYTFDGGFISILWVAVLFSGSYLYIRKAEVEDTKQAMVQASIFFIIGLVLLRVIQTII